MNSVTFNDLITNNITCTDAGNGKRVCASNGTDYEGGEYTLTIHVETIQCDAESSTWSLTPTTLVAPATLDTG